MYFDSIIPNPRPSSLNQKHFFNGEKPCSFYLNGDVITLNKVLGEKLKYRPWFWNAGAASRNNCSEQTAFNVALFVPLPSWLWFQLQFFLYFKIERPIKLACIFNHQIMTWSTVWTDCTKWRPNSPAAPFFHFSKEDLIEFADVLGNRKPDRTFTKKEAKLMLFRYLERKLLRLQNWEIFGRAGAEGKYQNIIILIHWLWPGFSKVKWNAEKILSLSPFLQYDDNIEETLRFRLLLWMPWSSWYRNDRLAGRLATKELSKPMNVTDSSTTIIHKFRKYDWNSWRRESLTEHLRFSESYIPPINLSELHKIRLLADSEAPKL